MQYPAAARLVRKLPGGSQAHLIQADDENYYALKSPGNPQGTRVLINEYLGSKVFVEMGIASSISIPIVVSQKFLNANREMAFALGTHRIPLKAGVHLGCRYEVSPEAVAIYDFIPDTLIYKINNTPDFLGALVADKWLSNQDARQFVFFRDQRPESRLERGFRAVAIDHGFCIGADKWLFGDSPLSGVYFRAAVYRAAKSKDLEAWLERLNTIDEGRIGAWISEIPSEWLIGEMSTLLPLIPRLIKRRGRVADLVETSVQEHPECFPSWGMDENASVFSAIRVGNDLSISAA